MKDTRSTTPGQTLRFVPPPGSEDLEPGALDRHFARTLLELNGSPSAEVEIAAQTVSAWRGAGHICVPLRELPYPALAKMLRATAVAGGPGEFKPLILDAQDRLYLHRYFTYEADLARLLRARIGENAAHDPKLLLAGLDRLAPKSAGNEPQRRAARTAIERTFCVITGGPGTGKTRTVVVVLALLLEQFSARGERPRIALAAPTGKAGARLKESIQKTAAELALSAEIRAAMPAEGTTLHRLLGTLPDSPYFRHDAKRPLAADIVIVDEASMVDLALMAKLVAAVPPNARLVLLGDKDQLASVEAGYVLGDLCGAPDSAPTAPLREHIVELEQNFRFGNESGIFHLSVAVNRGAADDALALFDDARFPDIRLTALPTPNALGAALREQIVAAFAEFRRESDPNRALLAFHRFRLLAALRRGPYGVENLNRLVEQLLAETGVIDPTQPFYAGRPIVILRNEYQLHLYNGDIGIVLPDAEADGELRAFFLDASGALRRLLPAQLPAHETVFAMTVHKSQGSEFERVLLVLPDHDSPLVTRELVYTAITRARSSVEVWANPAHLRTAIGRRTLRTSGLREALWLPRES